MARFYLSGNNSRGNTITAQGTSTGQTCHLRGWDCGVRIDARAEGPSDVFDISLTGGSRDVGSKAHLVRIVKDRNGKITVEHIDNYIDEEKAV
jgi:hypothetical protein